MKRMQMRGTGPTDSLVRRTSSGIRERGTRYYRRGAVRLLSVDVSTVRAHVLGTRRYSVDLTLEDDRLSGSCDCPYFVDNASVCKHIWATLLAAEDDGFGEDEDFIDDDGDPIDDDVAPRPPVGRPKTSNGWAAKLDVVDAFHRRVSEPHWPDGRELLYIVSVRDTLSAGGDLAVDVAYRDRKRDGSWGKRQTPRISSELISQLRDTTDRQLLAMVLGAHEHWPGNGYYSSYNRSFSGAQAAVPASIIDALIPLVCRTGRGWLRSDPADDEALTMLRWDEGPPWELVLEAAPDEAARNHVMSARLERGEERMSLAEPALLHASGFVFSRGGTVAGLAHSDAFAWISLIRRDGPVVIPVEQTDGFLERLVRLPSLPTLDFPPSLRFEEVEVTPRPRLQLYPARHASRAADRLGASLSFDYGGQPIASDDEARGFFRADERCFVRRDFAGESAAAETLRELGLRPSRVGSYELVPRRLPKVVRTLTDAGWHVEAEGKLYRTGGAWTMSVTSGIDWFDLSGSISFDGSTASLPELLAALRRGEDFVALDDGSIGMLPDEWLARYGVLASVGTVDGDRLRFKRTQVGLLDALLASQPEVTLDDAFQRARDEVRAFERIDALREPPGFIGELRTYQREGLGWLAFLERFGFGGCLADDMGLGKTVQVLALLESRRELRARGRGKRKLRPTLVVVPKSLVFNWQQEAERFTPKLKLLDHTGARLAPGEHFDEYDVVLTTYGTLRRDAAQFACVTFDYCILDEAQAVNNAATASAKAARLIRADHRLALSGTPIQNHLGELWSLFEFLNPGVLGSASVFNASSNAGRSPDASSRVLLSRALRPFILRRTKDQVATDLPPKSEQTLYCELNGAQRKHYNQLRTHFQRELLDRVDRDGMNRSKMFVLEALLRLRQAACHPALIDASKAHESSAKLDLLVPQLIEVVQEGHKALVFSQFTKLLAIVRDRLDREGVVYEYLDGRTRNRQSKVERFQSDDDCRLFLISLKAGGLGLNLTAAEYVFLLDPWWNPAVEAQAIDRTHRIGQTRS